MLGVTSETADPAYRPRSRRRVRSRDRRFPRLASGISPPRRRTASSLPVTNNGDLTAKESAAQAYAFAYDLSSNLRSAQATGTTSATIDYVIDGMNRRIGKTITPGAGSPVSDGLLYNEQRRVVAELDGSNNVLSTLVYGLKPNVPDYMVRGGTTYRIVSDWRGDVRLVLDTTKTGSAAVVEQIDYDEWGNVTNLVDPACTLGGTELCFQPFGFAGGLWEAATGLVRFGARDYDPLARRWVSKDPIRFDGGINLYEYVGDDPINRIDLAGKDPTFAQCLQMLSDANTACLNQCKSTVLLVCSLFGGQSPSDCRSQCQSQFYSQANSCLLTVPPGQPYPYTPFPFPPYNGPSDPLPDYTNPQHPREPCSAQPGGCVGYYTP
jgi:RHS repeat-associated protein